MRILIIAALGFAAAACSDDDADNKAGEADAPATVPAGQWQTGYQVTAMRSTDNSIPAVAAKVGDKGTGSACVAPGEGEKPTPALFAGDGYTCSYKSSYIKQGTINATLICTRKGVTGQMGMTVQGSYTARTLEGTVETNSFLPGSGDFAMSRKISGRLAGPACQPAAPEAAGAATTSAGSTKGGKAGG